MAVASVKEALVRGQKLCLCQFIRERSCIWDVIGFSLHWENEAKTFTFFKKVKKISNHATDDEGVENQNIVQNRKIERKRLKTCCQKGKSNVTTSKVVSACCFFDKCSTMGKKCKTSRDCPCSVSISPDANTFCFYSLSLMARTNFNSQSVKWDPLGTSEWDPFNYVTLVFLVNLHPSKQ